ncbi:MAG: hypothetical protein Q8J78_02290 [Moraxellaceae bacterium]|nr:hypothetical protein [Moraxellaceae bacterium]
MDVLVVNRKEMGMIRALLIVATTLFLVACGSEPESYADCLLSNLDRAKSKEASALVNQACIEKTTSLPAGKLYFDLQAARAEGYSDSEILEHLASKFGLNISVLRQAGKTDTELAEYLSSKSGEYAELSAFFVKSGPH